MVTFLGTQAGVLRYPVPHLWLVCTVETHSVTWPLAVIRPFPIHGSSAWGEHRAQVTCLASENSDIHSRNTFSPETPDAQVASL